MIGDRITEMFGQTSGMRVLPSRAGAAAVEVSFQQSGELFGLHATDMGTYESVMRPDGRLYGSGQGVLMTLDGDTASWKGTGLGQFRTGGGVVWRGSVYYETTAARLDRLNQCAYVFEFEVDDSGKTQAAMYEWK